MVNAITESIYYDADNVQLVSRIKLSVEGTNTGNAEYYVSTNGGSTWQQVVTLDSWKDITNGNDLRLKIENTTGAGWPTDWNTWGSTSTSIEYTNIELEYELI